jgi:hypothetical protein
MNNLTRISIAIACALGTSAALAQSVERNGATVSKAGSTQTVAQASTAAPIQTAQAGAAAGSAAGGASAGGAAAGGIGVAGSTAGTLTFVGAAAASVAGASGTTSH